MKKLSQEQLDFILNSAVLAPSADNHHRIRFQVNGDMIRILHTENILKKNYGYKRVLTLLSLGALLENLVLASSRFGMALEMAFLSDAATSPLVVDIRFDSAPIATDPLWQFIPARHTNRRLRFSGPPMTDPEHDHLAKTLFTHSNSCELIWFDNSPEKKKLLHIMRIAETERFRNRLLHSELFSAVRFDVGWNETCDEGLPPGALGVEPPMRVFFALLRNWPLMKLANLFGMHHMLGFRACYLPCRLAPNLGLLSVKSTDNQSIIDAGRTFQRLWLIATSQNRVLQPMPASALYALKGACGEGVPSALQHELASEWKTILEKEITPLMLFRIGKADPMPINTERHSLSHYLDPN